VADAKLLVTAATRSRQPTSRSASGWPRGGKPGGGLSASELLARSLLWQADAAEAK
jgi:hypothetical protein